MSTYWGSDCARCGNTTPGSNTCSECLSGDATVALYAGPVSATIVSAPTDENQGASTDTHWPEADGR